MGGGGGGRKEGGKFTMDEGGGFIRGSYHSMCVYIYIYIYIYI